MQRGRSCVPFWWTPPPTPRLLSFPTRSYTDEGSAYWHITKNVVHNVPCVCGVVGLRHGVLSPRHAV